MRSFGGTAGAPCALHDNHEVTHRDPVADLDLDLLDGSGLRGRNLHGRLVELQADQRVVDVDLRTRLDVDFDDRDILKVADIGNADFVGAHREPLAATRTEKVTQSVTRSGGERPRARGKVTGEPGRERAVDDPVIIAETRSAASAGA